jgi:hypothetical protein
MTIKNFSLRKWQKPNSSEVRIYINSNNPLFDAKIYLTRDKFGDLDVGGFIDSYSSLLGVYGINRSYDLMWAIVEDVLNFFKLKRNSSFEEILEIAK